MGVPGEGRVPVVPLLHRFCIFLAEQCEGWSRHSWPQQPSCNWFQPSSRAIWLLSQPLTPCTHAHCVCSATSRRCLQASCPPARPPGTEPSRCTCLWPAPALPGST